MSKIVWRGEELKRRLIEASKVGVDRTMSEAVIQSKQNHPGWKNVTSFAEGSIRIETFAEQNGDKVRGVWGSASCDYMIWLELKHGSALRSAADSIYPRLTRHIKEAMNA